MKAAKKTLATDPLIDSVRTYYEKALELHGTTAQGVDWKDQASQYLRFEQLVRVCPRGVPFTVLDFGCGYGELRDYLGAQKFLAEYHGYDISPRMVEEARAKAPELPADRWLTDERGLATYDYAVASGVFNVKQSAGTDEWRAYVEQTLRTLHRITRKGFSFNCLTSYSDADRMVDKLYYADPTFYFDFCKRQFSRNVALLHDYGLYEFTVLVRKDS